MKKKDTRWQQARRILRVAEVLLALALFLTMIELALILAGNPGGYQEIRFVRSPAPPPAPPVIVMPPTNPAPQQVTAAAMPQRGAGVEPLPPREPVGRVPDMQRTRPPVLFAFENLRREVWHLVSGNDSESRRTTTIVILPAETNAPPASANAGSPTNPPPVAVAVAPPPVVIKHRDSTVRPPSQSAQTNRGIRLAMPR